MDTNLAKSSKVLGDYSKTVRTTIDERQGLLDYFNQKTLKFQALTKQRAKIVDRSRQNLKKLQRYVSQQKKAHNLKQDFTIAENGCFNEQTQTQQREQPFPACAPLILDCDFEKLELDCYPSEGFHFSKPNHSETASSSTISTFGESEPSLFTKIKDPMRSYKQHSVKNEKYAEKCSLSYKNSIVDDPDLQKYQYWPEQGAMNVPVGLYVYETELQLFRNQLQIISKLTEELLDCFYDINN